ncbi:MULTISPECIES: hypothetical protein [unclassified Sphingobacterium]|nr:MULTISPECIES: hypothetical protein [unclassified Sphingobacterium]WET69414.1 MAG: hypothetical protein P0Y57_26595 [Sphingobacterium sp.]
MKKNTQDHNGPHFSGFIKTRLSHTHMSLGDQNTVIIKDNSIGEK